MTPVLSLDTSVWFVAYPKDLDQVRDTVQSRHTADIEKAACVKRHQRVASALVFLFAQSYLRWRGLNRGGLSTFAALLYGRQDSERE